MSDRGLPTVLVVEDENDSRQMIVDSLEAAGFRAAQSQNAADALARLDGFAYDALVVNVNLPDGDGLDLLDDALSRYPDMRCVVTTGFGSMHLGGTLFLMGDGAVRFVQNQIDVTTYRLLGWIGDGNPIGEF